MSIIITSGPQETEASVQPTAFTPPGAIVLPLNYPSAQLGNPVICDFSTNVFTYYDAVLQQTVTVNDIEIQKVLYTLIEQEKNIVETNINGRNGSVKEYISDKDSMLTIKGTLYAPAGSYPAGDVANLLALKKAPVSFPINNWYLQMLGITRLAIKKITWIQREGYPSEQGFEMLCQSDTPIGILMQQGNAQ